MTQRLTNIIPRTLEVVFDDNPAAAAGVLTSDNTQVTDTKKVTLGLLEYVFLTALTGAAYEVEIGADADASLTALATLINEGREAVAASTVLTSNNTNPTAAQVMVLGAKTYTFKAALTEVKASGVLTSDETNVSAGDTVTIAGKVYTFVSAFSSYVANEIMIGADADTSLGNLVAAINGASGRGEKYSVPTVAHTLVTSSAVVSHAITVTALVVGTGPNSYSKAETSGHLDWDGSGDTLSGGLASVENEIKIGADANATLAVLKAAINGAEGSGTTYSSATEASTEVVAGAIDTGAHTLAIAAIEAGIAGNSLASTDDSATLAFTDVTLLGGVDETPANTEVSSSAVVAHALTITALTPGAAGNLIAKAEDDAHLDWDGSGGFLTGGGSTIGTTPVGKEGGEIHRIILEAGALTGTPTMTLAITDADGNVFYSAATIAEGAVTAAALNMILAPTDIIKVTTTSLVPETESVNIHLR